MPCRPLRPSLGPLFIAALLLFGPLAVEHARTQPAEKRVLALYSTRRDGQFSIVGERDLPRILQSSISNTVDYYAEFIDLSRSPDPGYRAAFRDFLRQKYNGVRFDAVIAMQASAINFVKDFGDDVFAGTPVVFLSNDQQVQRPNSTGLVVQRNFAATVQFIRQLQPDVERIFVVTGDAATDRDYEKAVRQQLQPLGASGLSVEYLAGLSTTALDARLANLPKHSAVYYIIVSSTPDGVKPHPLNYVDHISQVANAPTYSWVDSTLDHGIVGGSLYSQDAAIERIGGLAARVLKGEAADSIAPVVVDLNSNEVDWRQLRRWRIDERRVPAGTRISFRQPTLWDEYEDYIIAAVTLVVMQSALIAGLLVQRSYRRRAEKELLESQSALIKSYERNRDLASRLLQAQESERSRIARELHDDICQRMLLLTIELESVARSSDRERAADAALTVARDISSSLRDLSHELHPSRLRVIGLVSALESLCKELSHAGVTIAYTHRGVPETLPADVKLCLFRVAQEALQNALKYSQASELTVDITGSSRGLTLTVVDDGVGFDVEEAWRSGVGLGSMFERVQALGGSLELTSRPGTRLVATLPLHVVQPDAPHAAAVV